MTTNQHIDELSGAEHFLVGVSPQYWSHTPMSIQFLDKQLGLVDGIDCIVNKNHGETRFIPVSKCELQGIIVNADQKSNGSCLYLIDDGTGVVDCLLWEDNDMYSLPSLVPNDGNHRGLNKRFRVGDLVRVFGKIKCVSIGGTRETIKQHGREWTIQDCVREVHITSMTSVSLNEQTNHWLRCLQFAQRVSIDPLLTSEVPSALIVQGTSCEHPHYLEQKRMMSDPVRNGADVLALLGPEIASKAIECSGFPAPDDAYGAWRVFGASCQCNLSYLESLLYCHCQATVVALDPHFKFRDAVLNTLIQMEGTTGHSRNGDSIESGQLHFQYKTIVNDAKLQQVAMHVLADKSNDSISFDRLFLQTFAALRKDGVVALLDSHADVYLLISRERVLEPHCTKLPEKSNTSFPGKRLLQNEQPAYLKNVPSARLQYVKKKVMDNNR